MSKSEYQEWHEIISNLHLSPQHFKNYVEHFHTKESDEYIVTSCINSDNLNDFLDHYYSYNPDNLLEDMLSFIEIQIDKEMIVC